MLAVTCCLASACLGCGRVEDPASVRGSTVVMAIPDVETHRRVRAASTAFLAVPSYYMEKLWVEDAK
jgi:hypothetical protein